VRILAGGLIVLVITRTAAAQDDAVCRPGKSSNEARTMASFAVPLAFSAARAPALTSRWGIDVGLEVTYIPNVDDATATPTICRPDKTGPENTDLLFALPRPRLQVSLPGNFTIEGSWVPPVRVSDVKANLFGVSLTRTGELRQFLIALRVHATLGKVEAPITCDDGALTDSTSPCYRGTRSNDSFQPNVFGAQATVSWALGGALRPYLGAGYNHLAPRFRVNYMNQFGTADRTRVVVDLDRAALFAGASWTTKRLGVSAEIYSAPADAVTGRVMLSYRLK
jgi:hypothetical protein